MSFDPTITTGGNKEKITPYESHNVPSIDNKPSVSTPCAKHGVAIITTISTAKIVFFIVSLLIAYRIHSTAGGIHVSPLLINNAIDAIGSDGLIEIKTRQDKSNIVISIKDDGPGIPMEIQKKVFDPCFTSKEAGKGTGLGLAISFSIIEKIG